MKLKPRTWYNLMRSLLQEGYSAQEINHFGESCKFRVIPIEDAIIILNAMRKTAFNSKNGKDNNGERTSNIVLDNDLHINLQDKIEGVPIESNGMLGATESVKPSLSHLEIQNIPQTKMITSENSFTSFATESEGDKKSFNLERPTMEMKMGIDPIVNKTASSNMINIGPSEQNKDMFQIHVRVDSGEVLHKDFHTADLFLNVIQFVSQNSDMGKEFSLFLYPKTLIYTTQYNRTLGEIFGNQKRVHLIAKLKPNSSPYTINVDVEDTRRKLQSTRWKKLICRLWIYQLEKSGFLVYHPKSSNESDEMQLDVEQGNIIEGASSIFGDTFELYEDMLARIPTENQRVSWRLLHQQGLNDSNDEGRNLILQLGPVKFKIHCLTSKVLILCREPIQEESGLNIILY